MYFGDDTASKTGETIRAISHNKTESISKVSELSPPASSRINIYVQTVAYPGIFFGGVQQIQLRTEDREDGDMGAVTP